MKRVVSVKSIKHLDILKCKLECGRFIEAICDKTKHNSKRSISAVYFTSEGEERVLNITTKPKYINDVNVENCFIV